MPILLILTFFIFLFSVLAYLKLKDIPEAERFNENLNLSNIIKILSTVKLPQGKLDKVLSAAMIFSVAFCVFTLIFVVSVPKQGEKFTEFYILNENGTANRYPANLSVGEEGTVNIKVISREHEAVEYELLIKWNDSETLHSEQISLGDNETFSRNFMFTAKEQGTKKPEFLLYKDKEIYRKLHLWINVNET